MKTFIKILKRYQKKNNIILLLQLIFASLTIILILFDLFMMLYRTIEITLAFYFWLAISLKITISCILLYLVLKTNKHWITKKQAAKYLDNMNQDEADTYQNAYELMQDSTLDPSILKRIIEPANQLGQQQEISVPANKVSLLTFLFILITLVNVTMYFLLPNDMIETWQFLRLQNLPTAQHKLVVEVSPGNQDLKRNQPILIEVINPEKEVQHTFFYKIGDQWREEALLNFRRRFDNVDSSFDYFIQTPFAVSDTFSIRVFNLPSVEQLTVKYDYPAYTDFENEIEENSTGNFKALIGTVVRLDIQANNPLETCEIIYSDGRIEKCLRTGKRFFTYSFQVKKSINYHFLLTDFLGNTSEKIEKSILAIEDEIPTIRIVKPGKDTLLTQNMLLPITIFAHDDFGLQKLKLHHFINENAETNEIIFSIMNSNTIETDHVIDLTNTFLLPGDKITYWVSVEDTSPSVQRAVSQRYLARFPSIEEIYQEVEEEESRKKEMLQQTFEKSKQLQEEFEQKRREMMKKEEYKWEDQQEIQKFLKEQENLNQDIQNIAEDYHEMIDKMQQNQALSHETLEKMQKIKELMEEIANDQLLETMQKMQEKMAEMSPEDLKKAMKEMKFSMEDFSEKLEQTLKLLEDIKKEQSLQKALEMTKEMEQMQEDLMQRTGEENSSELAKDQKQMQKKLESLEEQIAKSDSLLDAKKDEALKQAMKELQEQMEQDSLKQDLQESAEQLEQDQKQKAMKAQQQASSKMQKMKKKLEEMMQMMAAGSAAEMGEIIDQTIQRLFLLSHLQKRSEEQYTNDPFIILSDQIANYEGIQISLQKLYSVPMILLVLGPKFIFDANSTLQSYQSMFTEINEAKNRQVPHYLTEIKKGLNLMIFDLMQSKNNMQSGGGGGMQSLMQSMQQMGEQQMMMNMLTQELFQQMMQNGKMSRSMREQARKIAAQEERLAENLKRVLQNDPDAQKQTAAMNKMIEELEEISRLLKRNKIDQSLLDRQERILSRLIDAQKSIHKREFSKKRKSEISDTNEWLLPEEVKLKFDKMRRKALLNNDLKSYPKAFQELIKEYFKKVNEKANQE